MKRWLARRFKYTRKLEEERDTLECERDELVKDRLRFLNYFEFENSLGTPGKDMGWDPDGYKVYGRQVRGY